MSEKIIPPIVGYTDNSINCLPENNIGEAAIVDFERAWKTRPVSTPGYTQIGDVELIIPPMAITVDVQSNLNIAKTLRSKGSVITKTGHTETTITMTLYFSTLEMINGIAVDSLPKVQPDFRDLGIVNDGSSSSLPDKWYINGLRPLIAQFKKTPFVPIKNEDLHDVYGIDAVALRNITAQSVPGFPESILVTLTMLKFDYSSFLCFTPDFYDAINWKLFRWYYQQAMSDDRKNLLNSTYLAPYGMDDNIFKYAVIDESSLILIQKMINDLRVQDLPSEYNAILRNKSTLSGQQWHDGTVMKLGQLQQWRCKTYSYSERMEQNIGVNGHYSNEDIIWDQSTQTYMMPISNPALQDKAMQIYNRVGPAQGEAWPSSVRVADIPGGMWHIPPSSQIAADIMSQYNDVEAEMKKYNDVYDEMRKAVDQAEAQVKFVHDSIPGLYINQVQVSLDNTLAAFQVQQIGDPAYQYLSGGDVFIEMRMDADGMEAIGKLVSAIKYSERLVRDYKVGMANGFMEVHNDFVQLFGARSVVVTNLTINTEQSIPNAYEVTLNMIGFNRNQRDTEKIELINDVSGYTTLREVRHASIRDNMQIEERLLECELYPDLELPTIEELANFCNEYGVNFPYKPMPNCPYTGLQMPRGKYVDPDFYVYTPETMRMMLQERIDYVTAHPGEAAMNIYDPFGGSEPAVVTFPSEDDTTESYLPYFMNADMAGVQLKLQEEANNARQQAQMLCSSEVSQSGYAQDTIAKVSAVGNDVGLSSIPTSTGYDVGIKPDITSANQGLNTADKTLALETVINNQRANKNSKTNPDFIIAVGQHALNLRKQYGPSIWPSVMIGQAIVESDWGNKPCAPHNYFGLSTTGEGHWRSFNSFAEGMTGYAAFLTVEDKRGYYKYVQYSTSPESAIRNISARFNPRGGEGYIRAVMTVINDNNLTAWDDLADIGASGNVVDMVNQINQDAIKTPNTPVTPYNSKTNIGKLWKNSFQDALETDMRGRLARAFPTFQMMLIDEGKFISWVKMWDNFYGFNSLQSIDVVKSRKIAADICMITMTNAYHNLTDMDINADAVHRYSEEYEWHDMLFKDYDHQSLIEARKEKQSQLMLQTGARLHLRMGYGSNAYAMPVVFNGTITEIEFGNGVLDIIAQGDGIELGGAISSKRKARNDGGLFGADSEYNEEPRDTLCYLIGKHDNLMSQIINNYLSNPDREPDWVDSMVKRNTNPLGILHFGNPVDFPKAIRLDFFWNNMDGSRPLGDFAMNIYTSTGSGSTSEWIYGPDDFSVKYAGIAEGHAAGEKMGYKAGKLWGIFPWPEGDEVNINVSIYNKSTWDIAQTMALVAPDYVATVLPFEFRSTLFYGKPYWDCYYRYVNKYITHEDGKVEKESATEVPLSKPMSQTHIYTSYCDIITNKIKASAEGMRTNVIATFDGGETSSTMCADSDIFTDKQHTAVIEIAMEAPKKQTRDVIAAQLLRDFMKDMYKGNLIVTGDPSIKPYDTMYINDITNQMTGMCGVKQVVMHMNMESGFTTDICPDAMVLVDDTIYQNLNNLTAAMAAGTLGLALGKITSTITLRVLSSAPLLAAGKNYAAEAYAVYNLCLRDPAWLADFTRALGEKSIGSSARLGTMMADLRMMAPELKNSLKEVESVRKAMKIAKVARVAKVGLFAARLGSIAVSMGPGIIGTLAVTALAHSALDAYARWKRSRQAVLIMPLMYKGLPLTAGMNGHAGCIVGDIPSATDLFWDGQNGGISGFVINNLNAITDS